MYRDVLGDNPLFSGKTAGLGGLTARAYGGLQSQTLDDAVQPGLTPVRATALHCQAARKSAEKGTGYICPRKCTLSPFPAPPRPLLPRGLPCSASLSASSSRSCCWFLLPQPAPKFPCRSGWARHARFTTTRPCTVPPSPIRPTVSALPGSTIKSRAAPPRKAASPSSSGTSTRVTRSSRCDRTSRGPTPARRSASRPTAA
jgi:hypothetical protein